MVYTAGDISEFSELIGLLYDSVTNPEKLEAFLAAVTKKFNAVGAQILCSNFSKQEFLFSLTHGLDRTQLNNFSKYAFKDPTLPHAQRFETKIYSDRRLPHIDNFLETEISREFLQPMGIYERAGFIVHTDQDHTIGFGLMAGENRERFTDRELHMLSELQPHIIRAVFLQQEMRKAKLANNFLLETLNKVPIGMIVADKNCNVYFSNRAASTIFDRNRAVGMRHGAIYCSNAEQNRNLFTMVETVTNEDSADIASEPSVCRIEHPDDPNPLLITITGLPKNTFGIEFGIENLPAVMIYICDPGIRQETSEKLLGRLFGLTPSEAKTLKSLVEGLSVRETSMALGLTIETVRSYLKQIFEKTGCTRQSELIGMVVKSPAWIVHNNAANLSQLD